MYCEHVFDMIMEIKFKIQKKYPICLIESVPIITEDSRSSHSWVIMLVLHEKGITLALTVSGFIQLVVNQPCIEFMSDYSIFLP
jgi:hypothetical protein